MRTSVKLLLVSSGLILCMAFVESSRPAPLPSSGAKDTSQGIEKKHFTVEDIYSKPPITGELPSSIEWIPDNSGISFFEKETADTAEQTTFVIASVPSGERRVVCILDTIAVPEDLREKDDDVFSISSYKWAKTSNLIAFTFRGEVFTLDPAGGSVKRLTKTDAKEKNVSFSPDGKYLAFIRENDLFTLDIESGRENRITSTGCDTIMNGILDWVYMEELFTRGNKQAYWWSPDAKKIAFLQFNESPVPEFPIVNLCSLEPDLEMERYPKAGDPNPVVRVGVYDLESSRTIWFDSATADTNYVARVNWLKDSKRLAIEILNRDQNELKLMFADVTNGKTRTVLAERDSTWINITYMKHFYKRKPYFVWASERDGFCHLYLYKNSGELMRKLTKGPWVVSSLDGVDEKTGSIYFTALKKSILERHLYGVSQRGTKLHRITKETGTHRIKMSRDARFFIDFFSDARTPASIAVYKTSGKKLFSLAKSSTEKLKAFNLPYRKFFSFTSDEGTTYYCSMIKPSDFDSTKTYPAIVYVYGGPHAQVVRNSWGGSLQLWHSLMASRGYIIFSLDNRGSFGRGKSWENMIARRAGVLELHDQLEGVKYLLSLPYVDPDRIGIWGWSYGGFMTCNALLRAPRAFKAGAAVAPVTDWHLYDSIYTERYMGRPEDNKAGYDETSVLELADSLRSAFLIVHGTVDDNVHMQNSIQLINKLVEAGKDFDCMVYPGKEHSLKGRKTRIHLFKKLTKFFEKNL